MKEDTTMTERVIYQHPAQKRADGYEFIIFSFRMMQHLGRKPQRKEYIAFIVDLGDEDWGDPINLHVDGCDYDCENLEAAIKRGAEFYSSDPYKVVKTEDKYGEWEKQPTK